MPCYYCGQPFQHQDIVVTLDLQRMERQDHGGVLAAEYDTVHVHQYCLGDPDSSQ